MHHVRKADAHPCGLRRTLRTAASRHAVHLRTLEKLLHYSSRAKERKVIFKSIPMSRIRAFIWPSIWRGRQSSTVRHLTAGECSGDGFRMFDRECRERWGIGSVSAVTDLIMRQQLQNDSR